MDHTGIPLAGIKFSIARTNLTAISDDQGYFEFPSQVPTGKIDLFVDGRDVQVTQAGETIEYPALHFETAITQGQHNQLPHPIYLPPVHIQNTKKVGGNTDVTLTIPEFEGFKMIVKANSVTFPDGSTEGELVVNPVHNDRLPMVPPGTAGRFMATAWTLQPTGTRFDPPIQVHIPNTDGLKPGTVVPVVQWDHDMAQFIPMGLGTISEDGSELVTNENSGITKAGWGGGGNQVSNNDACSSQENIERPDWIIIGPFTVHWININKFGNTNPISTGDRNGDLVCNRCDEDSPYKIKGGDYLNPEIKISRNAPIPNTIPGLPPVGYQDRSGPQMSETLNHENRHAQKWFTLEEPYNNSINGTWSTLGECRNAKNTAIENFEMSAKLLGYKECLHLDFAGETLYTVDANGFQIPSGLTYPLENGYPGFTDCAAWLQ